MKKEHLERLEREAGVRGLLEALCERLSPTDLQSLLLEVARRRSSELSPAEVLRRYRESRFCRPAALDPRVLARFQDLAFQQLAGEFELVQLSPLAPLGACSALAPCDQNKIVSTVRNVEVCADPTNSLALEAAVRRRGGDSVHLAACQRVVRAQYFGEAEGLNAHFSLLGLGSFSRDGLESLLKQLRFHVGFLRCLAPSKRLRLCLTPLDKRGVEWCRLLEPEFSEVELDEERESGRGYYRTVCFKLFLDGVDVGRRRDRLDGPFDERSQGAFCAQWAGG